MNALDSFNQARLTQAMQEAVSAVKSAPTDAGKRVVYGELLACMGDLDRADKQFEAAGLQEPSIVTFTSTLRQVLRAAQGRWETFHAGRVPEFLSPPDKCLEDQLRVLTDFRAARPGDAADRLESLEPYFLELRGTCNGEPFEGFRDLDDTVAACFEILTTKGDYYWVAPHRIESIEFEKPKRIFDRLFRAARVLVRQRPDGVVYVPVTYVGGHDEQTEAHQCGAATDWVGEEGGIIQGLGQRMLWIGGEERSILEIESLHFDPLPGDSPSSDSEEDLERLER